MINFFFANTTLISPALSPPSDKTGGGHRSGRLSEPISNPAAPRPPWLVISTVEAEGRGSHPGEWPTAAELGAEPGPQFLTLRPHLASVQHSLPNHCGSAFQAPGCPGIGSQQPPRPPQHPLPHSSAEHICHQQPPSELAPFSVRLATPSGGISGRGWTWPLHLLRSAFHYR